MDKKNILKNALTAFEKLGLFTSAEIRKMEETLEPEKREQKKLKTFTINETCGILKISRPTLLKIRKNGQLPFSSVGRRSIRFSESDLMEYLNSRK